MPFGKGRRTVHAQGGINKKRLARFEHCEEAWRGLTMQR